MYDRNPRKNQKLFALLCRKLSSMGILKSLDFMEESKTVRSVYRDAFKSIVLEAVKSIENEKQLDIKSFNESANSRSPSPSSMSLVEHTFTHFFNNTNESSIPTNNIGEEIFLSGRSRYREDFIEGGLLGRGGYGKVVVAVNKLDGTSYAIKKINFSGVSSSRFTRILREVKSLARLDHPNIVRYNSAWIEDHSVILERTGSFEDKKIIHELESVKHDFSTETSLVKSDSSEDTFTSGISSTDNFEEGGSYAEKSLTERTHVFHLHSDSLNEDILLKGDRNHNSHGHVGHHQRFQLQDRKIMYIQMELCRFTLDQYIKARNSFYFECLKSDHETILNRKLVLHDKTERTYTIPAERLFSFSNDKKTISLNPVELDMIFKGIVKGLHYIHEHGMIHRDLKPMNIFFHNDLVPKIGDFGLVSEIKCSCGYNNCANDREESSSLSGVDSPLIESCGHTKGIGTVTYASPEQLNQGDYTRKSDIYSLGIICFELFYPVATQMERTRVLVDLKHHHKFPESFLKQFPKEAAFIWSCIARDSEVRPSTAEILESEWLERDQEEIIARLEVELANSRKREEELMRAIEVMKIENEMLQRHLNINKCA